MREMKGFPLYSYSCWSVMTWLCRQGAQSVWLKKIASASVHNLVTCTISMAKGQMHLMQFKANKEGWWPLMSNWLAVNRDNRLPVSTPLGTGRPFPSALAPNWLVTQGVEVNSWIWLFGDDQHKYWFKTYVYVKITYCVYGFNYDWGSAPKSAKMMKERIKNVLFCIAMPNSNYYAKDYSSLDILKPLICSELL